MGYVVAFILGFLYAIYKKEVNSTVAHWWKKWIYDPANPIDP